MFLLGRSHLEQTMASVELGSPPLVSPATVRIPSISVSYMPSVFPKLDCGLPENRHYAQLAFQSLVCSSPPAALHLFT